MGDVAAENGAYAFERAGVDHHPRTAAAFLGGLEDQHDVAIRRISSERGRGAEDHGHVCVVAAGMHAAGVDRTVVRVGEVAARQRVEFRSQRDGGSCRVAYDAANDPAAGTGITAGYAETLEFADHPRGRFGLVERQFRVSVQPASQCDGMLSSGIDVRRQLFS